MIAIPREGLKLVEIVDGHKVESLNDCYPA